MGALNKEDVIDQNNGGSHKYCQYCFHEMIADASYWSCPGCEHREEISDKNEIPPSGKTQITDWVNSI